MVHWRTGSTLADYEPLVQPARVSSRSSIRTERFARVLRVCTGVCTMHAKPGIDDTHDPHS